MRTPPFFMLMLLLAVTAPSVSAADQLTGTLSVQISAINPDLGGKLRVALFRGDQGWPKFKKALTTRTTAADRHKIQLQFTDLPFADNYAVEIHHDENGNGKFDMRWLPYPRPKEGVGVSNNKRGFGPPDFADARFSVDSAQTLVEIQLQY
jgi:uncharacterized protein (DUF2141 family)